MLAAGCSMLDARCWMLDAGYSMLDADWVASCEFWGAGVIRLQIADFGLNGTMQSAGCIEHWAERKGHSYMTERHSAFILRGTPKFI